MDIDKKRAIDRELKRMRRKGLGKWLILAAVVIVVLLAYTPVFSTVVTGETTSVSASDRSDVAKTRLKITLDSGEGISIMADADLVHATGKRVNVSKMTSLFGMSTYQLIGYTE